MQNKNKLQTVQEKFPLKNSGKWQVNIKELEENAKELRKLDKKFKDSYIEENYLNI